MNSLCQVQIYCSLTESSVFPLLSSIGARIYKLFNCQLNFYKMLLRKDLTGFVESRGKGFSPSHVVAATTRALHSLFQHWFWFLNFFHIFRSSLIVPLGDSKARKEPHSSWCLRSTIRDSSFEFLNHQHRNAVSAPLSWIRCSSFKAAPLSS